MEDEDSEDAVVDGMLEGLEDEEDALEEEVDELDDGQDGRSSAQAPRRNPPRTLRRPAKLGGGTYERAKVAVEGCEGVGDLAVMVRGEKGDVDGRTLVSQTGGQSVKRAAPQMEVPPQSQLFIEPSSVVFPDNSQTTHESTDVTTVAPPFEPCSRNQTTRQTSALMRHASSHSLQPIKTAYLSVLSRR
jgi:hypothetical protein